ncbi:transglycosylase SLT domain-containing protein [Streptomyces sp. NPDC001020]
MLKNINLRGRSRTLTKAQKLTATGVAALSVAGVAFTAVPSQAQTPQTTQAAAAEAPATFSNQPIKGVKASVTDQNAGASLKAEAIAAKQKAAAKERTAQKTASRSTQRVELQPVAAKTYSNNLDGWIRQSLDIMKERGIPGSYHGLHKNIIRESSGNPMAINNWDINARNGIPSKGLLQVIQPTFNAYHVAGTSKNIYDPVANITAAANYAAHRYGSIDNVNSAY